jgi:RNA polymerase sigma-70 factor (ECF subfamily)
MDERDSEDRRLVTRLLRGDERAFDNFVEAYYPRLYRFVFVRLESDAAASHDVVQSVFQKVAGSLESYRGEAALFTWLCAFCRHEIAAHWRRRARLVPEVELREDSPEVRAALESLAAAQQTDSLERRELGRLVRSVLDRLPVRYGSALQWKYIEEVPVQQIAERLELTPKAAESLLTRARAAFRESFTEIAGRRVSS